MRSWLFFSSLGSPVTTEKESYSADIFHRVMGKKIPLTYISIRHAQVRMRS